MTATIPFPSRRVTAACLVAAGLLMTAGFAATPWEAEQTTRAYHDALLGHPDQAQVAAVLLHFGYLLLMPGAFGVMALVAPRGGWLLRIGGVLAVLGMATLPGLLITDAYDLALARELPPDVAARVSDAVGDLALSTILGFPTIVGVVLGMILLFLALWRAGEVPFAVPALVIAGWVVSFAGFGLVPTVAGGALMTLGFVLTAVRITRSVPGVAAEAAAPEVAAPAVA